jgi:hypothetical protein
MMKSENVYHRLLKLFAEVEPHMLTETRETNLEKDDIYREKSETLGLVLT